MVGYSLFLRCLIINQESLGLVFMLVLLLFYLVLLMLVNYLFQKFSQIISDQYFIRYYYQEIFLFQPNFLSWIRQKFFVINYLGRAVCTFLIYLHEFYLILFPHLFMIFFFLSKDCELNLIFEILEVDLIKL